MDTVREPSEKKSSSIGPSPKEKVDFVLAELATRPATEVELGKDGLPADLEATDFSSSTLQAKFDGDAPSWWNVEKRGLSLVGVDLAGANLSRANFSRADLTSACLEGVSGQESNFRSAFLSETSFGQADLRFANFQGAELHGADLGEANLWRAAMGNANLSEASIRHAHLGGAALEEANLTRAEASGADFSEALLSRASMENIVAPNAIFTDADLDGANLQGAILSQADFSNARLRGANLTGASLGGASFKNASLKDAVLTGLQLVDCDLTGVSLAGAKIQGAEFSHRQIGPQIGEELNGDVEGARRAYRALRNVFEDLGDDSGASWAYRRMQRMQRRGHVEASHAAWRTKNRRVWLAEFARASRDQFVEWICDYGDSIGRVLITLLLVFCVFGFVYAVTGSVVSVSPGSAPVIVRDPLRIATFTFTSLVTGGSSGRLQARGDAVQLLVGVQAFLGIALIGLLGFTAGVKIRRP